MDAGTNFVITQIFFNNQDYFDYVERMRTLTFTAKVPPGYLPITDYKTLVRLTSLCGASIPDEVQNIFEPIQDD